MKTYMAIDQYGRTEHDLGPHPRKELMTRCGRKHADKMYVDSKTKGTLHTGWVIAGRWFTVYKVERQERKVNR
jgi:hypothetical protein